MRGFDRPLKPRWVYDFINTVEVGGKISDYDEEFKKITWELDGEVGRRKVRTVLSRYFLKEQENPRSKTVDATLILRIVKKLSLEECSPLMLFNILVRSGLIRTISKLIYDIYGVESQINYKFLRKKMVEKYGERDISGRSLRNFFHTFVHFGVFGEKEDTYQWESPLKISEEQLVLMFLLYSEEYLNSPQVIFRDLAEHIFMYFETPEMKRVAKKFDNEFWRYSQSLGKAEIITDKGKDVESILNSIS